MRYRLGTQIVIPSFLCLSQESRRSVSARRKESFQPKDLGSLDFCDKHRNEGLNWHNPFALLALMSFSIWGFALEIGHEKRA
ncbi:hypothetical protein CTT39_02765 [Agrobacterium rosae]|nr:hypothetical protein CTT39_02765 [Agrobacterium rosae]